VTCDRARAEEDDNNKMVITL